jgi:hypothetical protein
MKDLAFRNFSRALIIGHLQDFILFILNKVIPIEVKFEVLKKEKVKKLI